MTYLCALVVFLLGIRSLGQSYNLSDTSPPNVDGNETPLSLLVLGPYPNINPRENPGWTGGPALIPAVRLAVDRINNIWPRLLPGYRLQLMEKNSACEILSTTVQSFPPLFEVDPKVDGNVVGIIGPGCSEAATLLGDIGAKKGVSLVQISPTATSPVLTNTTRFNNTFRMLSSSYEYVGLFAELIEYNKANDWEVFAALYDGERQYFESTFRAFVNFNSTDLDKINIGFASAIYDFYIPLEEIELKYKVIFVFAGTQLVKEVMCLAYHSDPPLLYPVYQWIFHDRTSEQLTQSINFTYKGVKYNCSDEQMMEALEGAILSNYSLHRDESDTTTLIDLSPANFSESYKTYLENHTRELPPLMYSQNGKSYANAYYDATWALALSLSKTVEQLGRDSLVNYSYGDPNTTRVIKQQLCKIQFEGLLGQISFPDKTQESQTTMNIFQILNKTTTHVGRYSNESFQWLKRPVFVTGTFSKQLIHIHQAASYIFTFLALLIFLFTATQHMVYIICRNERSIKASSPKFAHLMFSGCYLLILLSVVITVSNSDWIRIDPESRQYAIFAGVMCNIVFWKLFIGLSLIMGSLCVQLWRLYRIFNHFMSRELYVSDISLTLLVLLLVCLNVGILMAWTLSDPLLVDLREEIVRKNKNPLEQPVILTRAYCTCRYLNIWLSVLFGISLLVSVCIVLLSSLNRGITRLHFKTTKSVNIMVYLIQMILNLCVALGYILEEENIHYSYVLWQISFLGVVFIVCLFVFLRPTLPVYQRLSQYHSERRLTLTSYFTD